MAQYLIYGTITYSSTANRTTAMNNMNNVVNAHVGVSPQAVGSIPAGINTTATAGVNIGLIADSESTAETFRAAFLSAWTSATRANPSYLAISKVGG